MDLHFPQAAQCEADVERLKVVVQRSRHGLLDVSLSDNNHKTSRSISILRDMLDIILAESYRWGEFKLSDRTGNLNIFNASPPRLPRLEAARLYHVPPRHSTLKSVFKDCPRLTKLTICQSTLDIVFPWEQITELELRYMDFKSYGEKEGPREWISLIGRCLSLEILSMPQWGFYDLKEPYTPITCSNMSKLDIESVPVIDALTLPVLREASLHPSATEDSLYSLEQLLIRSNYMNGLTGLSLTTVSLGDLSDRTLHSILSQTHSLAFLNLIINLHDYDQTDQEQIVMLVNSLEVIPTEPVTCLPLLSSLDIRICNHRSPWSLE